MSLRQPSEPPEPGMNVKAMTAWIVTCLTIVAVVGIWVGASVTKDGRKYDDHRQNEQHYKECLKVAKTLPPEDQWGMYRKCFDLVDTWTGSHF